VTARGKTIHWKRRVNDSHDEALTSRPRGGSATFPKPPFTTDIRKQKGGRKRDGKIFVERHVSVAELGGGEKPCEKSAKTKKKEAEVVIIQAGTGAYVERLTELAGKNRKGGGGGRILFKTCKLPPNQPIITTHQAQGDS